MIRKIRLTLAVIFFSLITLLFLDVTGTVHVWLGWMAKVQFLPAVLALHVGVVIGLLVLTLLFGRIYCSVICPLGVMQDIISWLSGLRNKRRKRLRFSYSPARSWLRYSMLAVFVILLVAGVGSLFTLLAPYSAYGRIAQNVLQPIYLMVNNGLAYIATRIDSYAFYERDVWVRSVGTLAVAVATFFIIFVRALRN